MHNTCTKPCPEPCAPDAMPGMEIRPFYEVEDLAEFLTGQELSTPHGGERGKLGVG